jgi:acyl-[acyl-carrier-protein]-phospholipid O-acyltransferase/long-chain-fatty-acid--[acyl-carrier-protein] ligase
VPFWALLTAYGLGMLHDQTYKMLLALIAVQPAVWTLVSSGGLALASALFILPVLALAGYARHRAPRYPPRTRVIVAKACEVLISGLGCAALLSGRIEALLGVAGVLALRAVVLGPATWGLLATLVPARASIRVHTLLDLSAWLAMILGMALGTIAYVVWLAQPVRAGVLFLGLAVTGAGLSLLVPSEFANQNTRRQQGHSWHKIGQGVQRLRQERVLWLSALGCACFWFLVALLHMEILILGTAIMPHAALAVGWLATCLALGLGLGRFLVERLAGLRGELGLVPLGALGLGSGMLLVTAVTGTYGLMALSLGGLGLTGACFYVPLQTLLHNKSPVTERGAVLAATNVLSLSAILLAAVALWLGHTWLGLQARQMIALAGLSTCLATLYVLYLLPAFVIRLVCWMLTHTLYRIRVLGAEHIPRQGPALLVCNHVSYVDGLLVAACVRRFIRFLIYRPIYEAPALHWLFRLMHAIPIAGGPGAAASLAQAREALQAGHVVCIFAEGSITRTGNLLPFRRGFEQIMAGLQVPIIPMHLDQLWGSMFSFQGGSALGKWPRKLPYPVTISFAPPLPATATAPQVRQVILELGSTTMLLRPQTTTTLPRRLIAAAKRRWSALCIADTTAQHLTYGQALVRSLVLARWLRTRWPQVPCVGVCVPTSATAALLHMAIVLSGKVPITLDPQWSSAVLRAKVQYYGLSLLLTAQAPCTMSALPPDVEVLPVDATSPSSVWYRRLGLTLLVRWLPTALVQALWTVATPSPDALAIVVSTAEEAEACHGVMLSHRNILATVEGLQQVLALQPHDCLLGVLPLSHALGALATLWFPLIAGCGVVYHADAAEAQVVGAMVARYRATMLVATPTMYTAYLDACPVETFASLRYAVSGTEPLEEALAEAFHAKYGVALVAGYGCAEMAAIVALNIADVPYGSRRQLGSKAGTVGQPLPGVALKIVEPTTGQPVPPNTVGTLWLYGSHRMLGYWGQPAQTAYVFRQGWYVTNVLASLDEDGFLRIMGSVPSACDGSGV